MGRWVFVAAILISCLPICATAGPAEDLSAALQNKDISAMEKALAEGAPVDRLNGGLTPLMMAAAIARPDMVKVLLDHGANPNLHGDAYVGGATAITVAAGLGAVDVISLLIDRGVSVDSTDLLGLTPIALAASQGKTRSIALLYARGANVNAAPPNGMTPLHYAAAAAHRESVELLVALGANTAARDSAGRTPSDLAASANNLTPDDRATVLAWLAPSITAAAAPVPQNAHGCPHTHEDLTWFYRTMSASNPKIKDPSVIAIAVDHELKSMGCPG